MTIPCRGAQGPLNLLTDSTGIKAEGEGEWHARKHGGAKRRFWRQSRIGVDEQTLEIRAIGITGSSVGDAAFVGQAVPRTVCWPFSLPEPLSQIPAGVEIGPVTADGAHDTRKCHDAVADRRPCRQTAPQERKTVEAFDGRCDCQEQGSSRVEIPWPRHLAKPERIPPSIPRRDEDALRGTAGAEPHGA